MRTKLCVGTTDWLWQRSHPKYYFDPVEEKCKQFTWGGMGGIVPFQTLEECEACGCE
jgi:hypothetical protein